MTHPPIARGPLTCAHHYHARATPWEFWERSHMTGPPVILPPFDEQSALRKVQVAQDAWNTRDPERVALAYTEDSQWRNRDEFFTGREAIKDFLRRKWARELDYVLRKELWCYQGNRISVRFEYESHDPDGPVVAQPRQRALGVRRGDRAHAPPRREHQRLPHRGERAADRHRLTAQGGRDALVRVGVADGEAQVVGGEAGKEAHAGAPRCPARAGPRRWRRRGGVRRARSSRRPGGRWRRGPRSAQRRGRRAGERSRARWPRRGRGGWRWPGWPPAPAR